MKIAFDAKRAYHNTSGLGNYSRDLIKMLATSNPSWNLFAFNTKKSHQYSFNQNNVKEILPKGLAKNFPSYWRRSRILKEANSLGADIFHGLSNEIPTGKVKKTKTVVSIHDTIFIHHPEWYQSVDRNIYLRKTAHACKNADRIVAISETTKQDLISFFDADENKIDVIYQSCHPTFLEKRNSETKEKIREKYQLPKDFILCVGTIEERKNISIVLDTIAKRPDLPLVIIGKKTSYWKKIEYKIERLQMEHRVFVPEVNNMEDLAGIYQMAKVFIYPSLMEGFGIPIIEALFSECPVITNYKGVFPEAAGPDSHLVNTENIAEIREKIDWIINNPEESQKKIEKSRQFAQKFETKNLLPQWEKLYKSMI
ncbi:MAG: glycosyltransferase family 4 protein [Flavobacteriales bacterium]|jgi:glycosyltransferase involved in cell wall biosynthesis|nr:glycosyltransferase family 4 protein [Flavobacteriales bacterium]